MFLLFFWEFYMISFDYILSPPQVLPYICNYPTSCSFKKKKTKWKKKTHGDQFVLADHSWAWGLSWSGVYPELLHWWTQISPSQRLSIMTRSLVRLGLYDHFLSFMLELCLAWVCASLCLLSQALWALTHTCPVLSRRHCFPEVIYQLWLLRPVCLFHIG